MNNSNGRRKDSLRLSLLTKRNCSIIDLRKLGILLKEKLKVNKIRYNLRDYRPSC